MLSHSDIRHFTQEEIDGITTKFYCDKNFRVNNNQLAILDDEMRKFTTNKAAIKFMRNVFMINFIHESNPSNKIHIAAQAARDYMEYYKANHDENRYRI